MMLQAFPSAQSSITADSPKVYLFAVEEFSLDALKRACRSIVRGGVKDLKADFPPSAPRLAQIVKDCEDQLRVEIFEAAHTFVAEDSEAWEKMKLLKNDRNLMTYERTMPGGQRIRGWFFKPEEVDQALRLSLPPPVPPEELKAIHGRLRNLGFSVGDPDGAADAA